MAGRHNLPKVTLITSKVRMLNQALRLLIPIFPLSYGISRCLGDRHFVFCCLFSPLGVRVTRPRPELLAPTCKTGPRGKSLGLVSLAGMCSVAQGGLLGSLITQLFPFQCSSPAPLSTLLISCWILFLSSARLFRGWVGRGKVSCMPVCS